MSLSTHPIRLRPQGAVYRMPANLSSAGDASFAFRAPEDPAVTAIPIAVLNF